MLTFALLLLPVPVTPYDLGQHSERYHGRMVRIELVLEDFEPGGRWHVLVEPKDSFHVIITGSGTPDAKKGDKVAIIGKFRYTDISFSPRVVQAAVMQKIPFDVKPEQLRDRTYEGRLIRVEDEVGGVYESQGKQFIELKSRGTEIEWPGKLQAGDRVRVTGIFVPRGIGTFDPPRISNGKVEKLMVERTRLLP